MKLKGRLKLIADKTPICNSLCDIGTDHAYIPIYLVKNGKCIKAIASDVRKGPLEAAKENINRYGLSENIETRLGNGLETISSGEVETVIIAGMGGTLISEILQKGYNQAKEAKQLILQPMNDIDIARKWLMENEFEIYDEELVEEGSKIYNVVCARWTGRKDDIQNSIYYYIGKILIERKDPLLKKLIAKKLLQLETAFNELQNANEPDKKLILNYSQMVSELKLLKERI